jgi:hypothetical protein
MKNAYKTLARKGSDKGVALEQHFPNTSIPQDVNRRSIKKYRNKKKSNLLLN